MCDFKLLLSSPKTSITEEHHLLQASVQLLTTSRALKKKSLIIASFYSSFVNYKSFALPIAQAGTLYKTTWREGKREREVNERNHRPGFSKTEYQGSGINGLPERCLEKQTPFIDLQIKYDCKLSMYSAGK